MHTHTHTDTHMQTQKMMKRRAYAKMRLVAKHAQITGTKTNNELLLYVDIKDTQTR